MANASAASELRPMSFGEILDQSFRVYRRAWKPLLTLSLVYVLPTALMSAMIQRGMVSATGSEALALRMVTMAQQGDFLPIIKSGFGFLLLILLSYLLLPYVTGGFARVSAEAFEGRVPPVGDALLFGLRRYWSLLGLFVLYLLLLLGTGTLFVGASIAIPAGRPLTFLLMFVTMILWVVYFAFIPLVVVLEEIPVGLRPFARSFRLAWGSFWRLLGLGLVFSLLSGVLTWVFGIVGGILLGLSASPSGTAGLSTLGSLITSLGNLLVLPFTFVGLTITFYDLRIRKEGLDLELMLKSQAPEA